MQAYELADLTSPVPNRGTTEPSVHSSVHSRVIGRTEIMCLGRSVQAPHELLVLETVLVDDLRAARARQRTAAQVEPQVVAKPDGVHDERLTLPATN